MVNVTMLPDVQTQRVSVFTLWGPQPVKTLQPHRLHFFCSQTLHNSESPTAKQSYSVQ